jgi:hypothetical protein
VNNRCNFILKTIDADVPKGDEVCKLVEKSIGLSSRRNFETGCIRDHIIKHLYVRYPVDFQCGEVKIEDNYTTGGVLRKDVGAASLKVEVSHAHSSLKIIAQSPRQEVNSLEVADLYADIQGNDRRFDVTTFSL